MRAAYKIKDNDFSATGTSDNPSIDINPDELKHINATFVMSRHDWLPLEIKFDILTYNQVCCLYHLHNKDEMFNMEIARDSGDEFWTLSGCRIKSMTARGNIIIEFGSALLEF